MTLDTEKLNLLLTEKKFDEAKLLIKDYIQSPLSPEERGEALVFMTTTYMSMMNSIQSEYKSVLENSLSELDEINKAENSAIDSIALQKVRQSLA